MFGLEKHLREQHRLNLCKVGLHGAVLMSRGLVLPCCSLLQRRLLLVLACVWAVFPEATDGFLCPGQRITRRTTKDVWIVPHHSRTPHLSGVSHFLFVSGVPEAP